MKGTPMTASNESQKVFESRSFYSEAAREKVERIKQAAAILHDEFIAISIPPDNAKETGRLVSLAKTDLESSVMWAVKAVSRYNP